MVKGGGGDKAGDHGVDVRDGAEQATLSSCGKRTAMDKAGNYGFGSRLPESFYEDFASILDACKIEEGVTTKRTPIDRAQPEGERSRPNLFGRVRLRRGDRTGTWLVETDLDEG